MNQLEHQLLLRELSAESGLPESEVGKELDRRGRLLLELLDRHNHLRVHSRAPGFDKITTCEALTAHSGNPEEIVYGQQKGSPHSVPVVNGRGWIMSSKWPYRYEPERSWREYTSYAPFREEVSIVLPSYRSDWERSEQRAQRLLVAMNKLLPNPVPLDEKPDLGVNIDGKVKAVQDAQTFEGLHRALLVGHSIGQLPGSYEQSLLELVESEITSKLKVGDKPIIVRAADGTTRRYRVTDAIFRISDMPKPDNSLFGRIVAANPFAGPPSAPPNARPVLVVATGEGNYVENQAFITDIANNQKVMESRDNDVLRRHGLEPDESRREAHVHGMASRTVDLLAEDMDGVVKALEQRGLRRTDISDDGLSR